MLFPLSFLERNFHLNGREIHIGVEYVNVHIAQVTLQSITDKMQTNRGRCHLS